MRPQKPREAAQPLSPGRMWPWPQTLQQSPACLGACLSLTGHASLLGALTHVLIKGLSQNGGKTVTNAPVVIQRLHNETASRKRSENLPVKVT